jgi:pimeloyl-ACP methyl ester carboxylesterase
MAGVGPKGALTERVRYVHAADGHRLALTELEGSIDSGNSRGSSEPGDSSGWSGSSISAARPTFLLIHGFAQDRHAFLHGDIPRALVEHGAAVLVGELRGHGLSDVGARRDWSLSTHLRLDLPSLVDGARAATGAERIHLVGHSMGGILGYALLSCSTALASLSTFAAPVLSGRDRPLVRVAALLATPLLHLGRPSVVPIDLLLRALAPLLASPEAGLPRRLVRRFTSLANADHARPETLHRLLSTATPESPRVLLDLAAMALTGRAAIDGIDLAATVRTAPLPVASIAGRRDVFASRASLEPLEDAGSAGPRLVLEVHDALHVDLMVGRHARSLVDALWRFLNAGESLAESSHNGK